MKEKTLENKIKNHLKENKHYFFKVHGNGLIKSGIPDLIACIKGKFIGLEIKNPNGKGKLSELQVIHINNIINSGGYAVVIDDFKDYLEFYESVVF